jgi:hypothetical protein
LDHPFILSVLPVSRGKGLQFLSEELNLLSKTLNENVCAMTNSIATKKSGVPAKRSDTNLTASVPVAALLAWLADAANHFRFVVPSVAIVISAESL